MEGNTTEIDKHLKATMKFARNKFDAAGKGNHFKEVCRILREECNVSDLALLDAAILHDTLEDTEATYDELVQTFSKEVADLVQEVSHPKNYTHEQRLEYYEHLKHITPRAKMIKLVDFISHLRAFIVIYKAGKQSQYPKFADNDKYIASIRDFLVSCEESQAKETTRALTFELEKFLINS